MLFGKTRSIYLILGVTDMRKSINKLSIKIALMKDVNLYDGSMFVFCSKNKKNIKILFYDENGFCLFQKKLNNFIFMWPKDIKEIKKIDEKLLKNLINCIYQ